jgi:hypothetical protein
MKLLMLELRLEELPSNSLLSYSRKSLPTSMVLDRLRR